MAVHRAVNLPGPGLAATCSRYHQLRGDRKSLAAAGWLADLGTGRLGLQEAHSKTRTMQCDLALLDWQTGIMDTAALDRLNFLGGRYSICCQFQTAAVSMFYWAWLAGYTLTQHPSVTTGSET